MLQFDLLSIGVLLDRLPGDDAAGGSFQIRSLLILLRSRIRPDGNPPDRDLADGVGADFARVIFQFFPEHPAVGIVRRGQCCPSDDPVTVRRKFRSFGEVGDRLGFRGRRKLLPDVINIDTAGNGKRQNRRKKPYTESFHSFLRC